MVWLKENEPGFFCQNGAMSSLPCLNTAKQSEVWNEKYRDVALLKTMSLSTQEKTETYNAKWGPKARTPKIGKD